MSKIILLTGPAGAGKTSIAQKFLNNQSGEWAYIAQDDIRQLVRAGYASADGLRSEWSNETRRQWDASIGVCTEIAKQYAASGISSVIDAYFTQEEFLKSWKPYLNSTNYELIILLPSLEAVLQRNELRKYPAKLTKAKIAECYADICDWKNNQEGLLLDNSQMSIEGVVNVMQGVVSE